MAFLLAQGVDTFVEVGPGETLLSFVKRMDRSASRVRLAFGPQA
jgi:malonyl CoA-acyl carrier protein transacylase